MRQLVSSRSSQVRRFLGQAGSRPASSTHTPLPPPTDGAKAVHRAVPCPVCGGTGKIVSKKRAQGLASEGVITHGRRPPDFVAKGPKALRAEEEGARPERGEAMCYLTGGWE